MKLEKDVSGKRTSGEAKICVRECTWCDGECKSRKRGRAVSNGLLLVRCEDKKGVQVINTLAKRLKAKERKGTHCSFRKNALRNRLIDKARACNNDHFQRIQVEMPDYGLVDLSVELGKSFFCTQSGASAFALLGYWDVDPLSDYSGVLREEADVRYACTRL